jgi:hypothetical protein
MERHDIGCFLANVAGSLRRLTRAINPRFGMHFCVLASQPGHALFDEDQTDTPALSRSAEWSKCKPLRWTRVVVLPWSSRTFDNQIAL